MGGGGGGVGRRTPFLRDSTPCRYYLRYQFLVTDPKFFLKTPLAPIYTNFEGGAHAEKTHFLFKFSKKCLKTPFLGYFFKILPAVQKIWPKQGLNRA